MAKARSSWVEYCREQVWRHTPSLVTPYMGEALLAPFTELKLPTAFAKDGKHKCLGRMVYLASSSLLYGSNCVPSS